MGRNGKILEDDDQYEILQVSPTAESEVIDAAYRSLARRYHPDVNSSHNAAEVMRKLNLAYQVLGNRERRTEYDRRRALRASAGGSYDTERSRARSPRPRPETKIPKTPPQRERDTFWLGTALLGLLLVIVIMAATARS